MVMYRGGGIAGKGPSIDYGNFGGRQQDFRDIDKNGIDDRDEDSESKEGASTDEKDTNQDQQEINKIQQGGSFYKNIMDQIMNRSEDPSDTLGRDLKMGFAYNYLGKGLDYGLTKGMAEYQSGLYKDNALFGADLELRNQRDARADEFGYGMRAMDKQFELQNEYQNREFGRNIGYMQSSGEQTRKNYRAQGVEDRLARITQGEQDRLGIAARGDQDRRGYRVQGDEQRKNLRTSGKQDRKTIRTTAKEGRKTYDFEDRINARGEQRDADRSSSLARGF